VLSEEKSSIFLLWWPDYDEKLAQQRQINLAVQFNGKFRWTIQVSPEATQEEVINLVKSDSRFSKYWPKEIKKVIYVPGKIVNIVG